ncbi:MAG TPA: aspartate aminotransferase family protein [Terriglobales bacterium]|nr:aspartate aminotransferase family protein [Terriglobales bacterium]
MRLASVMRAEAALLVPTYDRYKVLLRKGRGVYVYDDTGRAYLDLLAGIGVNALGHGHPAIRKALVQQADKLIHVSNLFYHDYQAELAKRLTRISGLDRAFFCNSGTEAWEAALKFARAHARTHSKNGAHPAWRILALEDSFHGRTFGSLSTTATAKYREPFEPLVPGVRFVRANDVRDLERKFDPTVCAVGLETVQGESGIKPVTREFLQAARGLATRYGALLIIDEIQCGLGRTGRWFAYQHHGIMPDMLTVAKPLAAGLPLGALLTTDAVSRSIKPGMHGTTFGGGPLACAVAIAVIDTIEKEGLLERAGKVGEYFRQQLLDLLDRHSSIREVRGCGLMLAAELDSADLAKAVHLGMLKRRIILNRTHDTVLRFLPPFIIQRKHVDHAIDALDAVLTAAEKSAGTLVPTPVGRSNQ